MAVTGQTEHIRYYMEHVNFCRDTEAVCPENLAILLMPPQVEEDWENETCEIELNDWVNLSFGVAPYGKINK